MNLQHSYIQAASRQCHRLIFQSFCSPLSSDSFSLREAISRGIPLITDARECSTPIPTATLCNNLGACGLMSHLSYEASNFAICSKISMLKVSNDSNSVQSDIRFLVSSKRLALVSKAFKVILYRSSKTEANALCQEVKLKLLLPDDDSVALEIILSI